MATNSIITKVTGTDTSTNRIASTFYGTCSTGASTAAKAVTLSDSCVFNDSCLVTGVTIHVKFTNSNTNATPTLKVGTATAKQIMAYGTTATASWYAGSVVSFTYDGTYWIMNDYKIDTDTKVTQTATSTNSTYEVLFSNSANNTTETAGARKNNNLTFNPSSGTLDCTATGTNLKSAIRSDVRVELTQAQYDALVTAGTVDPNIIYLITDTSTVMSATDVSYDNAGSGLSATNVQGAIDTISTIITGQATINTSYVSAPPEINYYQKMGRIVEIHMTFGTKGTWSNTTTFASGLPVPSGSRSRRFSGVDTSKNVPFRFVIDTNGNISNAYSKTLPVAGDIIELNATYISES